MKAIVLHDFIDKNTKKKNIKGQKITVTRKRAEEINKAGFGDLIKIIEEKKVETDEEN